MKRKDFSKLELSVQKEKDINFEHEDYIAGVAPFLRGIESTMYVTNPLEIKKNANSSTKIEPKINPSNNFIFQKKGMPQEIKLAYTLAKAKEELKTSLSEGNDLDAIISNFSISWRIGIDQFNEIATFRAARMLWAVILKKFNPKNPKSFVLNIDSQISNKSLNGKDSYTILTYTTLNTMTAILGGVQCLDITKSNTENPTVFNLSDSNIYKVQQYIQEEIGITKTVDPWAGSSYIEKRTEEIANETWQLILEVDEFGGFSKALKKGLLKTHLRQVIQ